MTKKLLLITMGLLFFIGYTNAKERTDKEMQTIAIQQMNSKHFRRASAHVINTVKKVSDSPMYQIYSADEGGFVIIAKDDAFKPVLGYSTSNFSKGEMPESFEEWLRNTETSMKAALAVNSIATSTTVAFTPTENFVTTVWGQNDPFNFKSPVIGGTKAPSGCVATAMSQILYYFKYPAQGEGKGTYTKSTGSSISMDVKGVYLWDQMMESYKKVTLTDDIRETVSTLLFDAALASKMNFEDGGSGSNLFDAGFGFVNNFGYNPNTIKVLFKRHYSNEEWQEIIYKELAARRPILAGGHNDKSGHAFVLSGIDNEGLIYINWGWDGRADGFYAIDTWSPLTESYNTQKNIICGLIPSKEPIDISSYESHWVTDEVYTLKYQKIRNWMIASTGFIYNCSPFYFTGTINLCFENESGEIVKAYPIKTESNLEPAMGYSSFSSGTIKVTDLPAGTYTAYLASKDENESGYSIFRCLGGPISYNVTKDEDGVITVSEPHEYVTGIQNLYRKAETNGPIRFYDLQGREVNAGTKGLVIRRQGSEVKKIIVK